jgi:1-acyl-sn-glycerol-3-phosphate acyltransferase
MPHSLSETSIDSDQGRTPSLLRLYRLIRLLIHLFYGCLYVGVVFHFLPAKRRFRAIQTWSRQALRILKVRRTIDGQLPSEQAPTLVVCNHVSWLDISVIHSVIAVRFVAKADIRRWPVVGFLVSGAGTIFIERDKRHHAADTNRAVVRALERGEPVAIFPEGITGDGTFVGPYHASLFQPALGAAARVLVLALRYTADHAGGDTDVHYAGDRSLWESVRSVLAHRSLHAEVLVAGTVRVHGKTRREIAREAELLTAKVLGLPQPGKRSGKASDPRAEAPTTAAPTSTPYPNPSHRAARPVPTLTSDRR